MQRIHTLAAAAALAGAAVAQTNVVIPATAAKAEGDSLNAAPFAYDRARLSQYYGATVLRNLIPEGKTITEIAYRRDGRALNTTLMRHTSTPKWEIRMGRYTLNAKNPGSRFLPVGTTVNTLSTVFIKDRMNFPDLPGGIGPMAFRLRFKLDRPWVYRGDALVVDHFVYEASNPTFAYYVDAVRTSIDRGSYLKYGKECPAEKNRAATTPSNPGGELPLELLLFGARPSSPALAVIGFRKDEFAGIKLPLDLSFLGMTGCALLASMDIVLPSVTFTSGSAKLSIQLPEDNAFAGQKLYGQWIVVDPQINPSIPLTMSNGVEITTGRTVGKDAGIDGSVIYAVSNLARSSYGFLDQGIVLVTEFVWQ